jgi:hypothetical protein
MERGIQVSQTTNQLTEKANQSKQVSAIILWIGIVVCGALAAIVGSFENLNFVYAGL